MPRLGWPRDAYPARPDHAANEPATPDDFCRHTPRAPDAPGRKTLLTAARTDILGDSGVNSREPTEDQKVTMNGYPPAQGLYDPAFEHDACGVGFICHIKGKPSHKIVDDALTMLENMNHRGACGCEPDSGDGAGILVRTPDKFLRRECKKLGINLPPAGQYAVAMCFLPKDMVGRHECEQTLERIARENDIEILGWRDVPVRSDKIGLTPRKSEPKIRQM